MSEVKHLLNQWLESIPEVICFMQKIKVYAPTCHGECEKEVDNLRDEINKIFGGSTTYDEATGCWYDPKGKRTVCESVKVIEVAHNCSDKKTIEEFIDALNDYAVKTGQQSVSIHNGTFYMAETPGLLTRLRESKVKV